MALEVEISELDLRYESYRMKEPGLEARLLCSIAERGIEQALEGVESRILLNGFKRYRCARKLGIKRVPYKVLAEEEVAGIVVLLQLSNAKSLGILEQAGFIDELKRVHQLSVGEIALELFRSKSWVSMRQGLIGEMTAKVRERLFSGAFPVYAYMYTLRRFMRMNEVKKEAIEEFVVALSGKKLSVREIEQLAQGYFLGPETFRQQIREGKIALGLEQIKQIPEDVEACTKFERVLLNDLEILAKYMQRVMGKSLDRRLTSRVFHSQANLLTAGILSKTTPFIQTLRQLYDRSGQA